MTELLDAPVDVYTDEQKDKLIELAKLWEESRNPVLKRRYMISIDEILEKKSY